MTLFIRCLSDKDKETSLASAAASYRTNQEINSIYSVDPSQFKCIPGFPFIYWVSASIRNIFLRHPKFETHERTAKQGIATADDFRFLRAWWEISDAKDKWKSFAKGGGYSPFYADLDLVVNWSRDGAEIKEFRDEKGKLRSRPQNLDYCLRPGITWSLRPSKDGSFRAMPSNTVFSIMGSAVFVSGDQLDHLMSLLGLCNSKIFNTLIGLLSSRGGEGSSQTKTYDVGCLSKTPVPSNIVTARLELADLSMQAFRIQQRIRSTDELDHGFCLPEILIAKYYDMINLRRSYQDVEGQINELANKLYEVDGNGAQYQSEDLDLPDLDDSKDIEPEEYDEGSFDPTTHLMSWSVGVAFGRFNLGLATGGVALQGEPNPFDSLPAKSPGMLSDAAAPFHTHTGILIDDPGHPHDLVRLVEEVLASVDAPVPSDVRRWLQRDFFAFHLQRYSKSRRKAPIYWPLATASGSYTLWVYYPSLSSQTLYTAINDFIEPKLKEVGADGTALRNKGSARTRDEEKQFEALQAFAQELTELRDTLLGIAQNYQPNHDDGVQITASPLWPLFRHKPWQKLLKDTWVKLEKGDYDWAHLAMNYWPDRVREKCKTDKSLAIAHGLEDLYVESAATPKKTRKKKSGDSE